MKAFMEKCQFLLNRKTIEYVYDAFSPSISHTLSGFPCSSLYKGDNETYIEGPIGNDGIILYNSQMRDRLQTRRTKRNV